MWFGSLLGRRKRPWISEPKPIEVHSASTSTDRRDPVQQDLQCLSDVSHAALVFHGQILSTYKILQRQIQGSGQYSHSTIAYDDPHSTAAYDEFSQQISEIFIQIQKAIDPQQAFIEEPWINERSQRDALNQI